MGIFGTKQLPGASSPSILIEIPGKNYKHSIETEAILGPTLRPKSLGKDGKVVDLEPVHVRAEPQLLREDPPPIVVGVVGQPRMISPEEFQRLGAEGAVTSTIDPSDFMR